MHRIVGILVTACAAGVVLVAAGAVAVGQAAPGIVGTGTFTTFVENMDRTLAFYHEAFGMDVPAMPESGSRPYNRANPQLFAMFDIMGATERHQSARVPGTRLTVEAMEIQQVDHRTVPLRIQDPGAATLILVVRDLDAALAQAKQATAAVATPGGKPVAFADGSKAILVRDIDGRFIELRQPASVSQTSTSSSNIVDLRLSIAVADMSRTLAAYRDVMGFTVEGETGFSADTPTRELTGLSKADVRRSRVQAQGSTLWIELVEYKGIERTPLRMRIQDRGAARLQLRARNVDGIVDAMKRAGMTVVSQGGTAVPIPPNFKGALVADPNNFFLTPFEPCDNCGARFPDSPTQAH